MRKPKGTVQPVKCRLCGYEWEPRIKQPKACPRCKRYDWKAADVRGEGGSVLSPNRRAA